jgi:hypothetical protein
VKKVYKELRHLELEPVEGIQIHSSECLLDEIEATIIGPGAFHLFSPQIAYSHTY